MSHYVLLAESDSRYAEILAPLLESANYRFNSAYSLKEALSLAVVEAPSVLLLDMDHPPRESMRLLMDMKTQGLEVPVVWVSAHVSESAIARVRASGAKGLLSKETDAKTTLEAIKVAIEGGKFFQRYQPARKSSGIRSLSMDDRLSKLLQG